MATPADDNAYHRYRIDTHIAPGIAHWPTRFNVRVGKVGLAKHLVESLIRYRLNLAVTTSRPCVYGVFSGPVGGFAPRPQHCVACLRCMNEYPEFVTVSPNPQRQHLGDSYFTQALVDQITYEAETGLVPVKGAGYRGKFGGEGWDSMWTDMSEIVRPTRDGIHGREFISTSVDIGIKPDFLIFDADGDLVGTAPKTFSLPVPFIFDPPVVPSAPRPVWEIVVRAAEDIQSLVILPVQAILEHGLTGTAIVPSVKLQEVAEVAKLLFAPRLIELDGWNADAYRELVTAYPQSLISLRMPFAFGERLLERYRQGVRVFHLTADYHGGGQDESFALESTRQAHKTFVDAGTREHVTLLGSGGVIAAEHLPKAIICGLDLVAIDTALVVALQGKFIGECADRQKSRFAFPRNLTVDWGVQRLKNLAGSWRDQLFEILGAMGLREVRRLRGEVGRAMIVQDLEAEAFGEVDGYAKC